MRIYSYVIPFFTVTLLIFSSMSVWAGHTGADSASGIPLAATYSATDITQSSGVLNGFVSGTVNATVWFEWGSSASLGNVTAYTPLSSANGSVNAALRNLLPGTVYYYRLAVQHEHGITNANTASFSTSGSSAVEIATKSAISITATDATFVADMKSASGSPASLWFEWGVEKHVLNRRTASRDPGSRFPLEYRERIMGLSPGMTYYYRAVAQSSYGLSHGEIKDVRTLGVRTPAADASPKPQNAKSKISIVQEVANAALGKCPGTICIATAGHTLTVTISILNEGTSDMPSVIVKHTIPPYVRFVKASNGGAYDSNTREVRWDISIGAREHETVTVDAVVQIVPKEMTIESFATVASGSARAESNTVNVRLIPAGQFVYVTPQPSHLVSPVTLSAGVGKEEAAPGEHANMTFAFRNEGLENVHDAVLTLVLPSELAYKQLIPSQLDQGERVSVNGNVITFAIGELPSGSESSILLLTEVKEKADAGKKLTTEALLYYKTQDDAPGETRVSAHLVVSRTQRLAALISSLGARIGFIIMAIAIISFLLTIVVTRSRSPN